MISQCLESSLIKLGLCFTSSFFIPPSVVIIGGMTIAYLEKEKLIRELAALFLSSYYTFPDFNLYQSHRGENYSRYIQPSLNSYKPHWCQGRFFLDKIITLDNQATIFIGALPHRAHATWLKQQGCSTIISMVENKEYEISPYIADIVKPEEWQEFSATFHHFPSKDFEPVEESILKKARDVGITALDEGKSIYIHCKAGRGRCAAVAVAVIASKLMLSLEDSINVLSSARPQIDLSQAQQCPIKQLIVSEQLD